MSQLSVQLDESVSSYEYAFMASTARSSAAPLDRLGIEIGHHTDIAAETGMTAFLLKQGGAIGIHIPGGNSATFNTPAFGLTSVGETVHGVVLTGGSTYGLASLLGVMSWLEEHGIGNPARGAIVPGAVGAVVYDLGNGRSDIRPTQQDGYRAAQSASSGPFDVGRVGAGTGATVGKWYGGEPGRGGFGTATTELPHGMIVSAFVVTNSLGDVVAANGGDMARAGKLPNPVDDLRGLVGLMDIDRLANAEHQTCKDFSACLVRPGAGVPQDTDFDAPIPATTLAVVATNAALNKVQLTRVAQLANHGVVRGVNPANLTGDGDVIFALSSHSGERIDVAGIASTTYTDAVGMGAADAVMRAAANSVAP